MERDFPEVNAQKMIDQCIDLGVYCNSVWNTGGRWSMERLVWHVVSKFQLEFIHCMARIEMDLNYSLPQVSSENQQRQKSPKQ